MNDTVKRALVTACVTGILGVASYKSFADEGTATTTDEGKGKYECQGGNSCKGKGDCGGVGHSCAGKNACKGKGYVYTKDKAECDTLLKKNKAAKKKS